MQVQGLRQTVLAVYEPWFGDRDHMDVGYSSHDPVLLSAQVKQAQSLGIHGFVVDWYGAEKPYMDETLQTLSDTTQGTDFQLAIMYDQIAKPDVDMTARAISDLDLAYGKYIRPEAPASHNYLHYNGRPLIFIWPNGANTDWDAVKRHVEGWPEQPLLIFKDQETKNSSLPADGFYAWIHPGSKGWSRDGSEWGEEYLQNFYARMRNQFPDRLAIGAIWSRFDDRNARWGESRYMSGRCGRTLHQTLEEFRQNAGNDPFLLIATWNDYEEGTAIETGLANPEVYKRMSDRDQCGM